jgi:hypothetical protein
MMPGLAGVRNQPSTQRSERGLASLRDTCRAVALCRERFKYRCPSPARRHRTMRDRGAGSRRRLAASPS